MIGDPRLALAALFLLSVEELYGGEFLSPPTGFELYLVQRFRRKQYALDRRERIWQGSAFLPVRRWDDRLS